MNDVTKCPRCGADQPIGSTGGVCPRCAAELLQATQTDIPGEGTGSFTPPTVAELAAKFPQLEILGLIGRGGMGAVYQARQKELDRLVALKILPPDIGRDAAFAERFTREARALAKLNHPGIVTIYDFGRADGLYFFLMEFVDGLNLRELLHRQRISSREALAIVPQICDALQYAHDQGIVHRDIKPENLLIDRRGRVKVADFGLAKLMGAESDPASPAESPAGSPTLTEAGKIMGTPNYMSPEQVEHPGEVDHRADIYALGVVFYQMLTGELPEKQLQPPSRKVQIDVRLDEVVLRALEKEPERRYQQASTMKMQVETIAQGPAGPVPSFATRVNQGVDYKTKATLFGLPWLHVATGQDPLTGRVRIARGIFAIGGIAQGVVACGGVAMGGISLGGLSLGVFSYGGLAIGLLAFGGLGVGLLGALGGLAVAPVALGGEAIGWLAAGAKAIGPHVLDVAGSDPVARNFFNPWSGSFMKNAFIANYFLVVLVVLLISGLPMWLAWRSRGRTPGGNRVPNQPLQPGTVEAWLALMDQGDYAGSWAAASAYFQRAMRREEWVRRGETIRGPLGRVVSRQLISTRYKYMGTWVVVKYNTEFAGLTAAVETVTFMRQASGEWKSVGYLIRPAGFPEVPTPGAGGLIYSRLTQITLLAATAGLVLLGIIAGMQSCAHKPVKTIQLLRATNQMVGTTGTVRSVDVWTDTPLRPDENLQALVKMPDGQMREAQTIVFTTCTGDQIGTTMGFTWILSDSFGQHEADEATAQIAGTQTDRAVQLRAGIPLEMFKVKNGVGGTLTGYIEYNLATATNGLASATVLMDQCSAFGASPYIGFSARVPAGCVLRATASAGRARTMAPAGPNPYRCDWSPPYQPQRRYDPSAQVTWAVPVPLDAWERIRRMATNYPSGIVEPPGAPSMTSPSASTETFEVIPGQPRLIFSLTNGPGDVWQGYLELVGPEHN